MVSLENHIKRVSDAIEHWLRPDNYLLKEAIDRTVNEGLFSFPDLKHRILTLKKSLRKNHLERWARISGLIPGSMNGKRVLCLHAGNLPLVGIQDLLAVLLTGGTYSGKMSRKDPYLLPTLIKSLYKYDLIENADWSTKLESLSGFKSDAVLFAGSKQSAEKVNEKLHSLNLAGSSTPRLMRTAHFSIAYIRDNQPETMENLTEAVFRYGGTGCRSVAVVVAPFFLNSQKCSFTDYVEAFWMKNPQHQKPSDSLFHRFAYNKGVGIEQAWLNDFLIEENVEKPIDHFILYWVKGGARELEEIIKRYRDGLQSVYTTGELVGEDFRGYISEPLEEAQNPPIWWKPDGIDTIQWLQKQVDK